MNIGDFINLVSESVARGTTLNDKIPRQMKLAVNWLERNYTFKYMERFRLVQIAMNNRIIPLQPGETPKGFKFFRTINNLGNYQYLKKLEPEDLNQVISTVNFPQQAQVNTPIVPTAYFQVGNESLVLNAIPTEAMNAEIMYYVYTDVEGWQANMTDTHPLLISASDLLLAQTLLFFSTFILKDLRMIPAYKEMRDEAVNTMTRAEDEVKYGGDDISMVYNPGYDIRLENSQPGR